MKISKAELCLNAMELFREKGFEQVSVEDICIRCHVTRGSFYHHFHNKYDVLTYWERCNQEKEIERLQGFSGMDPRARLFAYLSSYAEDISSVGCELLYRIMLATLESGNASEISHIGMGTYIGSETVIQLLTDAFPIDRTQAQEWLRLYNMTITGLVFEWRLDNGAFSFRQEADRIAATVFKNRD